MLIKQIKYQLILASGSPRRINMLRELGLKFHVIQSQSKEYFSPKLTLRKNILSIARNKIETIKSKVKVKHYIILGADTSVVLGKSVIGKPKSSKDAIKMLTRLSGKTHVVWTGIVFLRSDGLQYSLIVRSRVKFKTLLKKEIIDYVNTGEPMDKAGAYAIQGKGAFIVESIYGSYTNVVGLPVKECVDILREFYEHS